MRYLSLMRVGGLALFCLPSVAMAEDPAKPEPTLGIRAGETMPFFVADFCYGEHKDHGGCPGVIISNHGAKGVLILARTTDENVLALATALEKNEVVDGSKVLSFVVKIGDKDGALAANCAKAGLKATEAGTCRDQSPQRLAAHGLEKEIELAVLFLDRKTVKVSHLLKADELTGEKRKEIASAAAAWTAAK
jgi:hypothetical protein